MYEQYIWTERYRPQTLQECILPAALVATFQKQIDKGELENMILAGKAGTGKTTVARALCQQIDAEYLLVNASDERNIDTLRDKISRFASSVSMVGAAKRKYVILDEADYLNPQSTQPALRAFIEEYSHNCGFILTVNYPSKLLPALHSRCPVISFDVPADERPALQVALFKRLFKILKTENVTCDKTLLGGIVRKFWPDMRRMLGELQRHSINGEVSPAILTQVSDASFDELITAIRSKQFTTMRNWLGTHSDTSQDASFYTELAGRLEPFMLPEGLPTAMIVLADYQYKFAFVSDTQLNAVACCADLMLQGGWRP
jgi:DNA polymerase III delta prime subunit